MLAIRPLEPGDVERVQELASDPAIGATSLVPSPFPADGAAVFVARSGAQRAAGTDFVFALVAEPGLVGVAALHGVGAPPGSAELGYWVGRPFWGRGFASAGAGEVVRWGFATLGLARITSHCLARNTASARVLRRLGFRETGRVANTHPKWSPDETVVHFELLRRTWSGAPPDSR
ncbi:MAG: GNAT family N-acetyltransferase [Thermoanaerobaculia bacterium]|nr:GNAT family N-acetyltransferase [Thermoanaerobaculia bacterium]